MNMYDLYKPFRNKLRRMALKPALEHIWRYQQEVDVSGVLKFRLQVSGPVFEIYVWELHLLCREIVLHASGSEDTIATREGLCRMIDHIRRISTGISERTVKSSDDALRALHPLVHQQARWQFSRDEARLFRTYHIYNDEELAPIFKQATGLSVGELFFLAMAICGSAKRKVVTNASQDYSAFDVTQEARDTFFKMTGTTLANLRHQLERLRRDDEGWAFTWNAMESMPFISLDGDLTPALWCPLPDLLLRRVSEGLFYDLCKGEKELKVKFGNEYGRAFERYIGRVLREVFASPQFSIVGERPYTVGKDLKHGVDWIVSDATGNLFIECKTRRMMHGAKEISEGEALEKALDELAVAVVQLYENIDDATQGLSKWLPNGLPVYPIVVTYEDWYLLTPMVIDQLNERVRCRLEAAALPKTLVETMPFFIASIHQFEMAAQDMAYLGLARFCSAGATAAYRHFQLGLLADTEFPNEAKPHRRLLESSWNEIFPKMQEWSGMTEDWWTQPAT